MKDHYISVDQARYSTYIAAKYLDTDTVNTGTKFYKTNLPSDMIFTKADTSTIDVSALVYFISYGKLVL